jgi:hypothetical protein
MIPIAFAAMLGEGNSMMTDVVNAEAPRKEPRS